MAGSVPTLYRFDRWDERIGLLRVVGELLGRQVKIGIVFDNELFARPAKIGNIVASARRFACTYA